MTHRQLPATREEFLSQYWLKEELAAVCRANMLPASGSKADLTEKVACLIEGKPVSKQSKPSIKAAQIPLKKDMLIINNYRSDENHRRFFQSQIGDHFSFNVSFMNWMKENAGRKTYSEAIEKWNMIDSERKSGVKREIGRQFEYNRYTRDFFRDNPTLTREDCIACWTYRKAIPGDHSYRKEDVLILKEKPDTGNIRP